MSARPRFQRADDLDNCVAGGQRHRKHWQNPAAPDDARLSEGGRRHGADDCEDQAQLDDLLFQRMTPLARLRAPPMVRRFLEPLVSSSMTARTYEIRPPRPPREEPTTHDYRRKTAMARGISAGAGAARRFAVPAMMAKKKRDYDAADRVQQLLRDAGVYVDDRARTYEVRPPRMKREVVEKTYSRSVEDDSNIALAPHDYEQLVQTFISKTARRAPPRLVVGASDPRRARRRGGAVRVSVGARRRRVHVPVLDKAGAGIKKATCRG